SNTPKAREGRCVGQDPGRGSGLGGQFPLEQVQVLFDAGRRSGLLGDEIGEVGAQSTQRTAGPAGLGARVSAQRRRMGVPAAGDGSFGGTQLPWRSCPAPLDAGQLTGTGVTQVHPSTGEFGRFEDRGGRVRGTGWFGAHSCPHWVGAWSVKQGSCVLTHHPTAPFTLDIRSRTPPMTRYRKTFGPKGQISGDRCSTCGRMAVVWTSYQASGSAGSLVKA